jgi:Zn-finger nucleic acid-binding protein
MSDEKDRLGSLLRQKGQAIVNRWGSEQDEQIIAKLREKYAKRINCPACGEKLDPSVEIGLGGMACPRRHGAWLPRNTQDALRVRLENAAAAHEHLGEKVYEGVKEILEHLRKTHDKDIHCPDCGTKLEARAAEARGEVGLGGMVCPNRHGAWLDRITLEKARDRLDRLEAASSQVR